MYVCMYVNIYIYITSCIIALFLFTSDNKTGCYRQNSIMQHKQIHKSIN